MRYVLVSSSMLVLACFGEAPAAPTTGDDSTSTSTSTSMSATTMSSADSSTTSTADTSAQTTDTVDTSDDDAPTTGPDCEMGAVPTPPKPPGMWGGPGYMIQGDEPPMACPSPLGTGPHALRGSVAEIGTDCPCRCEGEFLDICNFSFVAGANCTMQGLDAGGAFASPCEDLPGPQQAIEVLVGDSACAPMPTPPPAAEIQLCSGEASMSECFPLRDDMRGPCFWSSDDAQCPDGLETIAAHLPTCLECDPCDHTTYCEDREWTAYDAFGCGGTDVVTVSDDNCHLGFSADALSVEVTPGGPLPECAPAALMLETLTVCCVPQ